jgi:hypothetical protein
VEDALRAEVLDKEKSTDLGIEFFRIFHDIDENIDDFPEKKLDFIAVSPVVDQEVVDLHGLIIIVEDDGIQEYLHSSCTYMFDAVGTF